MPIPTALAPTVELATPKVSAYTQKIAEYLKGEITRFYTCDPEDNRIEDRQGNKWIEGSWGLHLLVDRYSLETHYGVQQLSSVISIGDVSIRPVSVPVVKIGEISVSSVFPKIELIFWLTARVMR